MADTLPNSNRSSNKSITIDGITKNLEEWINYLGLKSSTVRQRFYVYGWNIKKSLELRG
jgi:hypothetical protein